MSELINAELLQVSLSAASHHLSKFEVSPSKHVECPHCGTALNVDPVAPWFWWCDTCGRRWWPEHLEFLEVIREQGVLL